MTSLIKEDGIVKGVVYKTKSGKESKAFAPLTVVCDGCFSNLRHTLCSSKVKINSELEVSFLFHFSLLITAFIHCNDLPKNSPEVSLFDIHLYFDKNLHTYAVVVALINFILTGGCTFLFCWFASGGLSTSISELCAYYLSGSFNSIVLLDK